MNPVNLGNPVNQRDQGANESSLLRLIACPYFGLERGRIDRYVEAGPTVAAHLRALGWEVDRLSARVFIDGEYIDQARWEHAVPQPGQAFVTRVIPMGGQGGGKDALRIVSMLALVVVSIFAPYLAPVGWGLVGSWTGAAFSAAITIAGSLAITGRIPPSRPRLRDRRQVTHG